MYIINNNSRNDFYINKAEEVMNSASKKLDSLLRRKNLLISAIIYTPLHLILNYILYTEYYPKTNDFIMKIDNLLELLAMNIFLLFILVVLGLFIAGSTILMYWFHEKMKSFKNTNYLFLMTLSFTSSITCVTMFFLIAIY